MDGHESDAVQLYLTQMGDTPLLSKEEEYIVARQIEITRDHFRRSLLATDYLLQAGVEIFQRCSKARYAWKTP